MRLNTIRTFITTVVTRTTPGKAPESLCVAGPEAAEPWDLLCLHRFAHKCATIIFPHIMDTCARTFPVSNRGKEDDGMWRAIVILV